MISSTFRPQNIFVVDEKNPSCKNVIFSGSNHISTSTPYLMDLGVNCDYTTICTSSSERDIFLLDCSTLQCMRMFPEAHSSRITSVEFSNTQREIFITSSFDGTVKIWDSRIPLQSCSSSIQVGVKGSHSADIWCVGINSQDLLVATALKEKVLVYDIRHLPMLSSDKRSLALMGNGKNICAESRKCTSTYHGQFHSDTVNSLVFHPTNPHMLFSGGDDDLVAMSMLTKYFSSSSSLSNEIDFRKEDTATFKENDVEANGAILCFSIGCPVRKISVVGPENESLFVINQVEQCSLWTFSSNFGVENSTEYYDPVTASRRANKLLSMNSHYATVKKACEWPNICSNPEVHIDESLGYVVDAFFQKNTERLFILAGTHAGKLVLFHAATDGITFVAQFLNEPYDISSHLPSLSTSSSGLHSFEEYTKGHTSTVRAASSIPRYFSNSFVLVTCGEDGKLCCWKQSVNEIPEVIESFSKIKNHRSQKLNYHQRAQPY